MGIFAAVSDNQWHPGIGDPTMLGWVTVLAYAGTFVLCVLASRSATRVRLQDQRDLWAILAALLLGLGINKQLDLQTWFGQVARNLVVGEGLYHQRRLMQGVFILAVTLSGLAAVGALSWRAIQRRWPISPLVGAAFLVTYVVIRAASFHHVDAILSLSIPGARLSSAVELVGITIIAVAARRASRPSPPVAAINPRVLLRVIGKPE